MINIEEINTRSISIENALDDIGGLCTYIDETVRKNLLNKDKYSDTVEDIKSHKKRAEGKLLITRETVSQLCINIQMVAVGFSACRNTILQKKMEKDAISGENHINSISMINKSEYAQFFEFKFPEKIIEPDVINWTVSAEEKKSDVKISDIPEIVPVPIETCGSINNLLNQLENLNKGAFVLYQITKELKNSYNEITQKCLIELSTITEIIVSLQAINTISGTENMSDYVYDSVSKFCSHIKFSLSEFKSIIDNLIKYVNALDVDFKIMSEAIAKYISADSLL